MVSQWRRLALKSTASAALKEAILNPREAVVGTANEKARRRDGHESDLPMGLSDSERPSGLGTSP